MSDFADRARELAREMEAFEHDRTMLKKMLAGIGGKAFSRVDTIMNILFLTIVVGLFVLSVTLHVVPFQVSIEVGVLLVSLKIAWMIHFQQKHQHFQFWVLNTIEFRLNEVLNRLSKLESQGRR